MLKEMSKWRCYHSEIKAKGWEICSGSVSVHRGRKRVNISGQSTIETRIQMNKPNSGGGGLSGEDSGTLLWSSGDQDCPGDTMSSMPFS